MGKTLPPIYGSVRIETAEQQRDMDLLLKPGPAATNGCHHRDPIVGVSMPTYSRYPTMDSRHPSMDRPQVKRVPGFHKSVHERSVFQDTHYARSFYIIHPDWTSEAATARALSTRSLGHDRRPSVQPLIEYIRPVMERSPDRDALLKQTIHEAKSADVTRRSAGAQVMDYSAMVRASISAIDARSPHNGSRRPSGSHRPPGRYTQMQIHTN